MIFRLVRMTLRERKSGLVGAFVALFGASALLTAFGILLQSGVGSGSPTQRYAAAAVVVSGQESFKAHDGKKTKEKPLAEPAPVPSDLVAAIGRVPGVARAVGDLTFPAQLVGDANSLVTGEDGRPSVGHGWAGTVLGPFTLTAGRPPQRPGEVVVDVGLAERAGVAPGRRVKLATAGAAADFEVTGVAALRDGGAPRTASLFFTDAQAAELSGDPRRVNAVGVLATEGTDPEELAERIEREVPDKGLNAHTGSERSQVENPDVAGARSDLQELSGSLGAVVVLISMIVVASTLALGVHQRRRELALLRAVAATPRQIYKMMAAEALLISLVAATLGCLPGILVARFLRWALTTVGTLPADFEFSYGPVPMVVAVAVCVLAAETAALGVARRAVAVRPVEAMGEAAVEQPRMGRARTTFGVLLFLLGVAASLLPLFFGSIFAVAGAGSGGLVMVIAVLLLGPPVVALCARLLAGPIRRRTGPHGFLAVANTRANARRLAAGIGPLTLAIGFALVQLVIPTTTSAAAQDQAEQGIVADFTVNGTGGVPQPLVRDAAGLPGVAAATGIVRVELSASRALLDSPEIFKYQAQGVTTRGLAETMDLKVTEGGVDKLRDGTVALSTGAANTLGVHVGERARLHLPDGVEYKPVVVAVYDRGLGFGDVTLPQETVLAHSSRRLNDSVFVKAGPGADRGAVEAALRGLGDRYPGTTVLDEAGLSAAQQDQATSSVLSSALPMALVFGYLAIAVANTLVMATLGRTREFALLRLVGAPAQQVLRMMKVEAGIVVITAVGVGTVVPLLPLVTISLGLTGSPLPHIPPLLYLGIVAVTTAIGALAILLPARWTLRTPPVLAIGLRE